MSKCCICDFAVKNGRNIFKVTVGDNSGITLSDVIAKCTKKTRYKIVGNVICKKCIEKCIKFYKAIRLAKEYKLQLLQLITKSAKMQRDIHIIDNVSVNKYGEVAPEKFPETTEEHCENLSEIGVFKEELINLEYELEDCVDTLQMEVTDNFPSFTKINLQKDEKIVTKFDYSDEEKRYHQKKESCKNKLKEEIELKCVQCNEKFQTQLKYEAHMRKKHFTGFICDECGKRLQTYSGFISHKQIHNPVKPFECTVCSERYHRKTSLKRHMAWHTGEKPFQCEICSKRFALRVALQEHMQVHEDRPRQLECEVCGYKFRTKAHLKRHVATHTGAKPFSCSVCGKCFSLVYNMKVHMQEHKNPGSTRRLRRFKCSKCQQIFTTKKSFEDHCQSICEAL